MADIPQITYTGVDDIVECSYVLDLGVEPSKAMLRTLTQPTLTTGEGELSFGMGSPATTLTFSGMRVVQGTLREFKGREAFRWQLQIADRRWKWESVLVSGEYNVRNVDGTIKSGTEKTPQQLATLLFNALGETGYSVSGLPSTSRPEMKWDGASAAKQLEELCAMFGCRVALGIDDRATVVRLSQGTSLPTNGEEISPDTELAPKPRTAAVRVISEPTRFRVKIKLKAVGLDTDDEVREVNALNYKPGGEWVGEDPFCFLGVSQSYRNLALDTVFRWYELDEIVLGNNVLPVSVASMDDVTVLPYNLKVHGKYWPQEGRIGNTDACTAYPGDFLVDGKYVKFAYPVIQRISSGIMEADLYLEAYITIKNGGETYRRDNTRNVTDGIGPQKTYYVPGILGVDVMGYDGCETPTGWSSNVGSTYPMLEEHAEYLASQWDTSHKAMRYAGIQKIPITGRIHQVGWHIYQRPSYTIASQGFRQDVFV